MSHDLRMMSDQWLTERIELLRSRAQGAKKEIAIRQKGLIAKEQELAYLEAEWVRREATGE